MKYLALVIIALLLACLGKNKTDNRQKIISEFLDALNNNEVESKALLVKYFNPSKFNDNSSSLTYHLMVLESIKNAMLGEKRIEISPYKIAAEKKINIYKIEEKSEDVFVIQIIDNKGEAITFYCLMTNDKIESLSILRKGNIVIGWVML